MRSMGLFCVLAFGCLFALAGCQKTSTTQAITHIYILFVCTGGLCVRHAFCVFSVYNVRAYMCVRLNVYKHKIMLISVNSFGYMKMML